MTNASLRPRGYQQGYRNRLEGLLSRKVGTSACRAGYIAADVRIIPTQPLPRPLTPPLDMTSYRKKMRMNGIILALMLSACILAHPVLAQEGATVEYEKATQGTRWLESANSDLAIKILVEASNLGSAEVEIAEITFPPGPPPPGEGHLHGSIEIFLSITDSVDMRKNPQNRLKMLFAHASFDSAVMRPARQSRILG